MGPLRLRWSEGRLRIEEPRELAGLEAEVEAGRGHYSVMVLVPPGDPRESSRLAAAAADVLLSAGLHVDAHARTLPYDPCIVVEGARGLGPCPTCGGELRSSLSDRRFVELRCAECGGLKVVDLWGLASWLSRATASR